MAIKVAIFEDDKDLADILKIRMESSNFDVMNFYDLKEIDWEILDMVLGDFRNKIVPFKDLILECKKHGVPLIAISGAETNYKPQLLKPFTIEELQKKIMESLIAKKNKKSEGFSLFGLFKSDDKKKK